ncbi:FGGY-family carbohydrate kinase [Pseudomonadales bacterium]|nr:FGGY-family carbohydrate kinase [Pseudomonadales bacterium]MDB9868749.1 FGGY-family carbohydrate kinase [Pseudomonadales bacterium]
MYLVLNLGLKSIRAIVFGDKGKVMANCSRPLSTVLNGDTVEQDGCEWWSKGIEVINEALENDSIKNEVKYITVTASSCCVVPVNKLGEPLSSIIMVSDKRASEECIDISKLEAYMTIRKGRSEFEVKSSLMIPKILWLKNNKERVFSEAEYFLSPNEYFGFRFTGYAAVDTLNAEKCFFNSTTNSYPTELLKALEIPIEKLPKVVRVGTILSQITTELKKTLNIAESQSIEYIVSTYDAICAFYGSGASQSGDTCDVSGTVTSLRTFAKGKVDIPSVAIFSQYQPEFDISIIGGSNNLGGGVIEWAKQAFYSEHESPYELMESEAKSVDSGADGVIFLPYLMGERAPLWNDEARGVFFGLSRNHNRKHMIRAIFDSAGFALRSLLEEIESTGQEVEAIRSSGGLSRIHLIAQIKADVLGKEIHIVDQYETTALGAYILMGISTGLYKNLNDASSIVRIREIIFPNPENHAIYSKGYQLYKRIYSSLLSCYSEHSRLHKDDVYTKSEKIENM